MSTPTIANLDVYPVLTSSPTYNPSLPIQAWERPLAAGESTTDYFVYEFLTSSGTTQENAITKGQAATPNVPPAVLPAGEVTNSTVTPPPVDLSLLPSGWEIVATPFGLELEQVAAPAPAAPAAPTTEDPNIIALVALVNRVLEGVNVLLTAFGKPTV